MYRRTARRATTKAKNPKSKAKELRCSRKCIICIEERRKPSPEPSLKPNEVAATKFTRFSELPRELRILVWKATFIPRRVTPTKCNEAKLNFRSVLALLHVNYESRQIFKENYEAILEKNDLYAPNYFNYSIDVLAPDCYDFQEFYALVKRLGSGMKKIKYFDFFNPYLDCLNLSLLPALEQVTLWFVGENPYYEEIEYFEDEYQFSFSYKTPSKARIVVVGGKRKKNNFRTQNPQKLLTKKVRQEWAGWESKYHWKRPSPESMKVLDIGRAEPHFGESQNPRWEFMAEVSREKSI